MKRKIRNSKSMESSDSTMGSDHRDHQVRNRADSGVRVAFPGPNSTPQEKKDWHTQYFNMVVPKSKEATNLTQIEEIDSQKETVEQHLMLKIAAQ
jgi:hypothetical protein